MEGPLVAAIFQSASTISGLVTFSAAHHSLRHFNSWIVACRYVLGHAVPQLTGVPFNVTYRYLGWLLSVPLLLMEVVLAMEPEGKDASLRRTPASRSSSRLFWMRCGS